MTSPVREKKTQVARFIAERLEQLDYIPEEEEFKKVTVRLVESAVADLDQIAGKLFMTRTACAENLLAAAIREASFIALTDPAMTDRHGVDPSVVAQIEDDPRVSQALQNIADRQEAVL